MKYIDTFAQSLLLLAGLVCTASFFFTEDLIWIFLSCQFYLGVVQVLSCVIHLIAYPKGNSQRRRYLFMAVVYLLSLFVFASVLAEYIHIPEMVGILYFTLPAWALGIYYYVITLNGYFPKIKRGFLPHLSF